MATKLLTKQSPHAGQQSYWYLTPVRDVTANTAPTSVTTTTASGTSIQCTKTAGGALWEHISPPLSAGVTISGTITYNVWAKESVATANASIEGRVYKLSGGVETLISQKSFVTELTTTNLAKNWTDTTPTSTAIAAGDRLIFRVFVVNAGTMAAGTVTCVFGGNTAAASGDTWVQFTEAITFQPEPEFIQSTDYFGGTSRGFNNVSVAGNCILVYIEYTPTTASVTNVTDDQLNTYSKTNLPARLLWDSSLFYGEVWIAPNIAGGTATTVTLTTAGSPTTIHMRAYEFTGIDATTPIDVTAVVASANSTNPAGGSITTSSANVCVLGVCDFASTDPTVGAGFVSWVTGGGDIEANLVSATGSYNGTFTSASQQWIAWTIPLKSATQPAAGGAAVQQQLMMMGVGS